jgi:PhzF family phenazine biosynthesis protein
MVMTLAATRVDHAYGVRGWRDVARRGVQFCAGLRAMAAGVSPRAVRQVTGRGMHHARSATAVRPTTCKPAARPRVAGLIICERSTRMDLLRIAAFADGGLGGNPAGVWLGDALPDAATMQRIAAEVGFSETAFAAPQAQGFRVRYFSPQSEVPFCGHATIALGAALALRHGDGDYALTLNHANIRVQGRRDGERVAASLQSPPTHSRAVEAALLERALALFGLHADDLDPRLPPAHIHAGADHLLLALRSRETLAAMRYAQEAGRTLMDDAGWITIALVWAEDAQRFHARNAFASGGVYEDPATGAAAAALAGYLRDRHWPHAGRIDIVQGEDMGLRSLLHVGIPPQPGSSVEVSGIARLMDPPRN